LARASASPVPEDSSAGYPTRRELALQFGAATLARLVINTSRRFPYTFASALSRGLGVPLTEITSLIAINQATGILAPVFGPLADRWGYRMMMLAGLGMLAGGMLAGGLLPAYAVVLLALLLAGLAKSFFDPALQAYTGERVPYRRRGLAIGIIEFSWAGSSLIGIPLVGLLIGQVGWRSPFLALGCLGLLGGISLAVLIPGDRHGRPGGGGLLNGFRAACQKLGHERAALGALGFSLLIAAANDNLFVIYGVWLEDAFGLSVLALGVATTTIGLAELLGEGLTAFISDRLGLKRALLAGLALSTLSYVLLPLIANSLSQALVGLFIIFITFEFTIVTGLSLFTEILPAARATMMSSNVAAAALGRVLGALIGGPVWLAGGLAATGLVSAAISALAVMCLAWGLRHWRAA
jgi:predicted MFS family arabinose efflux permease